MMSKSEAHQTSARIGESSECPGAESVLSCAGLSVHQVIEYRDVHADHNPLGRIVADREC
jgi:hypothetical protein